MATVHKEPIKNAYFSKVREAREAIMERAMEVFDLYMQNAKEAMSKGDFETAQKSLQFLMEHMPTEDGTTMVDISVDKPKQVDTNKTIPSINIGFAIGGLKQTRELPAANVIDIDPEDKEDE